MLSVHWHGFLVLKFIFSIIFYKDIKICFLVLEVGYHKLFSGVILPQKKPSPDGNGKLCAGKLQFFLDQNYDQRATFFELKCSLQTNLQWIANNSNYNCGKSSGYLASILFINGNLADCWICNFLSFVVSIKRHRQL
jgi:hypothetical protein